MAHMMWKVSLSCLVKVCVEMREAHTCWIRSFWFLYRVVYWMPVLQMSSCPANTFVCSYMDLHLFDLALIWPVSSITRKELCCHYCISQSLLIQPHSQVFQIRPAKNQSDSPKPVRNTVNGSLTIIGDDTSHSTIPRSCWMGGCQDEVARPWRRSTFTAMSNFSQIGLFSFIPPSHFQKVTIRFECDT